jgi:hypothetical protein
VTRSLRWNRVAAAAALAATLALVPAAHPVRAQSSYLLYYTLAIPPLLMGYESSCPTDQPDAICAPQDRRIYTGTLSGSIGGLQIQRATVTYRPGASRSAGGGEFALQTAAGTIDKGLILMTSDGRQVTLLFFGTYLGARIQFRVVSPAADFPTGTVDAKGVADTSFAGHSDYIEAVTKSVANLAPAVKTAVIEQANSNPALVASYQRTGGQP